MSAIDKGKRVMRDAVLEYRATCDALGYDCGLNMLAYMNSDVSAAARRANVAARALKAIDPDFPASWTPYPEGAAHASIERITPAEAEHVVGGRPQPTGDES